jgi:CPA1 family monovalent cation:H+ antiporter
MSWQQVGIYTVYAFLITLLMIIIRIVWACIKTTISYIRAKDNPERMHTLGQILKEGAVIGWVGMRGIVSLTLALALPLTLSDGSPLPGRNEVIYISFCVILFSLLLPGLTLPALINWLNLPSLHQHAPTLEARKRLIEVANEERPSGLLQ